MASTGHVYVMGYVIQHNALKLYIYIYIYIYIFD